MSCYLISRLIIKSCKMSKKPKLKIENSFFGMIPEKEINLNIEKEKKYWLELKKETKRKYSLHEFKPKDEWQFWSFSRGHEYLCESHPARGHQLTFKSLANVRKDNDNLDYILFIDWECNWNFGPAIGEMTTKRILDLRDTYSLKVWDECSIS